LAHRALGLAEFYRRRWAPAEEHLTRAITLDPIDVGNLCSLAEIYVAQGRRAEARTTLEKARNLEPNDPDVLADLGELDLAEGNLADAEARSREALEQSPDHAAALVVLGHVHLRKKDSESAKDHAAWVLRDYPNHRGALHLLAAIKAHQSPVIGAWWRWNTWMQTLPDARSMLVLLGGFALYRTVTILAEDAAYVPIVEYGWLAIVAYTWIGPMIFKRMLTKELATIRLRPDF
jgi:tetratricopeptide (TPR) repeat protein